MGEAMHNRDGGDWVTNATAMNETIHMNENLL